MWYFVNCIIGCAIYLLSLGVIYTDVLHDMDFYLYRATTYTGLIFGLICNLAIYSTYLHV